MRGDNPGCRDLLPRTVQRTLDGNLTLRPKTPRRVRPEIRRLEGIPRLAAFAAFRVRRLRNAKRPQSSWVPWARRFWKLYRRATIAEKQQLNGLDIVVPWVGVPVPKRKDMPRWGPGDG